MLLLIQSTQSTVRAGKTAWRGDGPINCWIQQKSPKTLDLNFVHATSRKKWAILFHPHAYIKNKATWDDTNNSPNEQRFSAEKIIYNHGFCALLLIYFSYHWDCFLLTSRNIFVLKPFQIESIMYLMLMFFFKMKQASFC